MNRKIMFSKVGAPSVLEVLTSSIPSPRPNEVVVKNEAIGFNFIDTYFRSGVYQQPLPAGLGQEGAGTVHAIGLDAANNTGIKVGDRVCYLAANAYSDYCVAPISRVALLPKSISCELAAASLLKGLTVQYLLEQIHTPQPGEAVLFHAGAGGVGSVFIQWATSLGAKVITTASTPEKRLQCEENGAYAALPYDLESLPATVAELNGGAKLKAVYDSVGKSTFTASLDCLAPRGILISFGNASGPVPPFSLLELSKRGSLFVTRPALGDYIDDFQKQTLRFFELVESGKIKVEVQQRYRLDDVAKLHSDAEARLLAGSTVIVP